MSIDLTSNILGAYKNIANAKSLNYNRLFL